mmetsp:Transcript_6056/g.14388  ORF Transcript_6056/g.14388 Transcript_6056/m.14388 type:complete len:441 (-) Transcript_6056:113-1435(-)
MVAKPEDFRVDRHHEFVSTVSLAGNRFDVGRRDIAWSSSFWRDTSLDSFNGILPPPKDHTNLALPHLPDLAKKAKVLMAHSQSRSPGASTTQMSLNSKGSGKPGRGSWGVKIREDLLQREDPVPVRLSGRRHGAAPDDKIRIWVRVPKGRLAFFVPPHLPLGPREEPQELLADDGRATPLRSLLARRNGQLCAEREAAELPGTVPEASATMPSTEQEQIQSAAKLSAISASQMSPCASSTVIIEGDRVESNFKSLVEAATGIPIPHQKLFYGPAGVLEDNSKALYQFEIGQGSLLHLSTRRDPRKVADYEERRKKGEFASFRKAEGMENPHHLLDERLFPRIRAFMNTKVGPKMGKDLVMVVPDWKKAGTSPLEYEWPHEQIWLDYSFMHDNGIFDFAGRIRKKFHRLPRLANAAASAKLVEAHAHTVQRSGLFNDEGLG